MKAALLVDAQGNWIRLRRPIGFDRKIEVEEVHEPSAGSAVHFTPSPRWWQAQWDAPHGPTVGEAPRKTRDYPDRSAP